MFKVATNPDGSIMRLSDALEAGYTYGDIKFFRGYRSRHIVPSEQTVLIARMIVQAARREAKLAWYYTYCGALEFARDAEIISEYEYTALANSWEDYGRATIERGAQR